MGRQGLVWAAFLAMCFVVVGLAGGFALYGAPVPLARGLAREAVLDQVLIANQAPDRESQLAALRPALGPNAGAVLDGPPDAPKDAIVDRVVRERSAVQAEAEREAAAVAARIRLTLVVVTIMAAIFGVGVLGLARQNS
jgi:hypothetical protein